eukprot:9778873-Prorocentrum_lima.AAC.1
MQHNPALSPLHFRGEGQGGKRHRRGLIVLHLRSAPLHLRGEGQGSLFAACAKRHCTSEDMGGLDLLPPLP